MVEIGSIQKVINYGSCDGIRTHDASHRQRKEFNLSQIGFYLSFEGGPPLTTTSHDNLM